MAAAPKDRLELLVEAAFPGARVVTRSRVQTLWSGYGEIVRLGLEGGAGAAPRTVVAKRVAPPLDESGFSHERKCKSYEVEQLFYAQCSGRLDPALCRVPRLLASDGGAGGQGETLFVLEDLDAREAGAYAGRKGAMGLEDARACVVWLAHLHRTFLHDTTGRQRRPAGCEGLWEQGCYWHLGTRPDEHAAMDRRDPLKPAADALDALLRGARHQTLLHGDAKLANFCWRDDAKEQGQKQSPRGEAPGTGADTTGDCPRLPVVAAVDFQYVGWGVGVLDVAYCLGSFPGVDDLDAHGAGLLDLYFSTLAAGPDVEAEWRALHCVAVADFERFLAGWAGASFQRTGFVGQKVHEALALI
jgi:hypothetical protein